MLRVRSTIYSKNKTRNLSVIKKIKIYFKKLLNGDCMLNSLLLKYDINVNLLFNVIRRTMQRIFIYFYYNQLLHHRKSIFG